MEKTRFNEDLQPKKRRLFRPGWQEKLPIKPILAATVAVLLLTVLVLINRPTATVLSSPELDVIRSAGVLRVGVDTDLEGMYQNGRGYERAVAEALATLIFGDTEGLSLVEVDRYTAPWRMNDGELDLVIMSMPKFLQDGYEKSEVPFFVDRCVILAYESFDSLAGKTIAVLENTASETLLKEYVKSTAPTLSVHPCADWYSMRVMLRAGTVDGACLPRTVAASWHESRTRILSFDIGALPYYAIAKKDSILLDLCSEVFYDWRLDGTFKEWGREFGVEWGANG
ncbi:MAG: transporter substrate-binding domain-containing protein [Clostridia bacterium]|nr:transporter substrate-binding domain-containing protein [Clostridia bacterium]